jgi:hypothetical protein
LSIFLSTVSAQIIPVVDDMCEFLPHTTIFVNPVVDSTYIEEPTIFTSYGQINIEVTNAPTAIAITIFITSTSTVTLTIAPAYLGRISRTLPNWIEC